jgi:hypothetical protein
MTADQSSSSPGDRQLNPVVTAITPLVCRSLHGIESCLVPTFMMRVRSQSNALTRVLGSLQLTS